MITLLLKKVHLVMLFGVILDFYYQYNLKNSNIVSESIF